MTAPELITYQTAEAYGRYIGTQYAQDLTDVDEAPEYWPPAFQRAFSKGFDAAINEFGEVEVVINLMSGKEVVQPIDTPWCCNVSSETYWCM